MKLKEISSPIPRQGWPVPRHLISNLNMNIFCQFSADAFTLCIFLFIFNLNVQIVIILGEILRSPFYTLFTVKTVITFVSPIPWHNNKKFQKQILLSIYLCYIFKKSKQIRIFLNGIQVWGKVSANRAKFLGIGLIFWSPYLMISQQFFLSFNYQISSPLTVKLISMIFVFVFDISIHLLHLAETRACFYCLPSGRILTITVSIRKLNFMQRISNQLISGAVHVEQ